MEYKIYELAGIPDPDIIEDAPLTLNYKTGLLQRLHPKHEIVLGELTKTTYYSDEQMTEEIVREESMYYRNSLGFATKRTTKITWKLEDGTDGSETKNIVKLYDEFSAIKELHRRRSNIVDYVTTYTIGLIMATGQTQVQAVTTGAPYIESLSDEISKYILSGASDLKTRIQDDTESFLDDEVQSTPIRTLILSEIV